VTTTASREPERPGCSVFDHEVVVRPADVDSAGHLNHVAMIAFFEFGRVRAHHDVRRAHPDLPDMSTVVRHLSVDYLGQASMFDTLSLRTWIRRDGTTSRTWAQELVATAGSVIARATCTSVLVDPSTSRAAALPQVYRDLFAPYREA
jgi:YbgC/YbaW family acyl-CoA thioester hydrolase